ncbi:hypothetical protein GCM10009623_24580 [Nocardioides aestuarii]|uniref:LemA family protein n=1 Tax=Nocardioides aestuarii TaxID=252231 RepID=A0ABW4TNT1_9ACTN
MTTETGEPEVLESDAPAGRSLRILGVLLLAAVVVGAALWAEGTRRAGSERRAIDACAAGATESVARAERRLASMASYVRPAFGTAPAEVEAGLMRLVSGQVPEASGAVDQALADCRAIDVWRFNTSHREARDAWIAFAAAEQRRLRAIAAEGSRYFTGFEAVSGRREEAEALWP